MRSTRIVVRALTPKGVEALKINMDDELALREKWKGVSAWRVPKDIRQYLGTVSAYLPKDVPVEHHISGFARMSGWRKESFYLGVKTSFEVNGCSPEDFEVNFFDE